MPAAATLHLAEVNGSTSSRITTTPVARRLPRSIGEAGTIGEPAHELAERQPDHASFVACDMMVAVLGAGSREPFLSQAISELPDDLAWRAG